MQQQQHMCPAAVFPNGIYGAYQFAYRMQGREFPTISGEHGKEAPW